MAVRIDRSLGAVAQGSPPGTLGLAEPALARAGPAGAASFLLEGERMAVTGSERRGDHAFWLGGRLVAEGLATDAGTGVNVVVAPASLRRELLGPRGSLLETSFVAPTLPLAAVQWQTPPGGLWSGAMELALVLLPGLSDVRYHVHGGGVRCVYDAHGDPTTVELHLHPAPAEWRLGEAADGGLRVRAALSTGTPVTLLIAAGSPGAASRAMAAAPHLTAHEARSAEDADLAALDTLRPVTDVPHIDHGVAWATARTRLGLLRCVEGQPEGVFWAGLGALAVGDAVSGGAAAEALVRQGDAPVAWRLGEPVSALALGTLLAARLTLLSGDPSSALEAHRLLPGGSSAGIWGLVLRTLADALRHGAPDEELRALREAAARLAGPRRREGAIRLPMAGGQRAAPGADALGRLLAADGQPVPLPSQDDFLGAWALWGFPDPDAAWTAWRSLVARGLEGGLGPRGTWNAPAHPPGPAPEAGLLLCGFAHGLLGLAPDAPSGRIRVAPTFPSHLSAFRAGGIRVGDATMELGYRREGRLHTLRLEPLQGRVPVTVVLEPSLPASPPLAVRVDGERAELDVAGSGGRVRFRVQLVLDAPRTVEVDEGPGAHPGG